MPIQDHSRRRGSRFINVALRVGAVVREGMVARQVLSIRNILVASRKLVERFGMPAEPDALHRFPVRCGRRASMFQAFFIRSGRLFADWPP
jgi:hypothetical protein